MQALMKVLAIVGCFFTFTDITVRKRITFYDRTHFIWYNNQKRKKMKHANYMQKMKG